MKHPTQAEYAAALAGYLRNQSGADVHGHDILAGLAELKFVLTADRGPRPEPALEHNLDEGRSRKRDPSIDFVEIQVEEEMDLET